MQNSVLDEQTRPDASEVAEPTLRLQKALDAADGGMLFIGPGVYYAADTLWIPPSTRVARAGY